MIVIFHDLDYVILQEPRKHPISLSEESQRGVH
jgi:hypothetical protein